MKIKAIRNTKTLALVGLVVLALAGASAGVAYKTHAFALGSSNVQEANDKETADDSKVNPNEDNGKDGETNDDSNKTTNGHTQDNGQDGETNDSPNQ